MRHALGMWDDCFRQVRCAVRLAFPHAVVGRWRSVLLSEVLSCTYFCTGAVTRIPMQAVPSSQADDPEGRVACGMCVF